MTNRRDILGKATAATIAAGLTACGSGNASSTKQQPLFLFVHGAWHASWCWALVIDELTQKGYPCVAVDLPGHGVKAKFPTGYTTSPQTGLDADVSPLAALNTNDYKEYVLSVLKGLTDAGSGPVILVGHSLGGMTITAVAEAEPTLIRKLVYLTAFCPINQDALHYIQSTEGESAVVPQLFQGDPGVIASARINPNSTAAVYKSKTKDAFFGDFTDDQFAAALNMLTPDEPIGALATKISPTATNWGSVPRAYIRCSKDHAIPIGLQDKMVREADSYSATQKFTVFTLDTSHSPFISAPKDVANLLTSIV